MSQAGLTGMQLATNDILKVGETLSDEDGDLPSAAKGWSVKDVISHAGNLIGVLLDGVNGQLVVPDGIGIEELNEIQVAKHREKSLSETLDHLRNQLASALPVFAALQDEPLASTETQLIDLGSYPLHAIVDMFTFDFTTHLRFDILKPFGPIDSSVPPLDEARLAPAVSWLLAGIPKMQSDLWQSLTAPLELALLGPAATSVVLSSVDQAIEVTSTHESDARTAARISSTTADFLAWSTTRLEWRDLVKVEGDERTAATFLDSLNLT